MIVVKFISYSIFWFLYNDFISCIAPKSDIVIVLIWQMEM